MKEEGFEEMRCKREKKVCRKGGMEAARRKEWGCPETKKGLGYENAKLERGWK